jgi:hypothetical protein
MADLNTYSCTGYSCCIAVTFLGSSTSVVNCDGFPLLHLRWECFHTNHNYTLHFIIKGVIMLLLFLYLYNQGELLLAVLSHFLFSPPSTSFLLSLSVVVCWNLISAVFWETQAVIFQHYLRQWFITAGKFQHWYWFSEYDLTVYIVPAPCNISTKPVYVMSARKFVYPLLHCSNSLPVTMKCKESFGCPFLTF